MLKVPLVRDPGQGRAVLALPPWVGPAPHRRERRSLYWHQPRSARIWTPGWSNGEVLFIQTWCGPGIRVPLHPDRENPPRHVLTDEAPEDMKCGTCAGRRAGHVREDGTIFAPRDMFGLPARCPGEGGPGWPAYCILCGERVRSSRYPYYGEADHRPLPALLERCRPCPQHGWIHAAVREGRLVCGRGWFDLDRCGLDLGPNLSVIPRGILVPDD